MSEVGGSKKTLAGSARGRPGPSLLADGFQKGMIPMEPSPRQVLNLALSLGRTRPAAETVGGNANNGSRDLCSLPQSPSALPPLGFSSYRTKNKEKQTEQNIVVVTSYVFV